MSESTEGIVLRRIDYSETSLILHFYTPDFGQVAALAKGAKRPKSAFQGGVDLLTRNQIVFLRRGPGGLATLTESAILDDYRPLRSHFARLVRAQYLVELAAMMTTEEDPNRDLYDLLVRGLEALASGEGDAVAQTIAFELGLLAAVGYALDWQHCVGCGRALAAREAATFSTTAGGVWCAACAGPPTGGTGVLGPGVLAAAALLTAGGRRAERLRLAPSQVRPLGLVLGRYITNLVGRPPRLLKYLEMETCSPTGGKQ